MGREWETYCPVRRSKSGGEDSESEEDSSSSVVGPS